MNELEKTDGLDLMTLGGMLVKSGFFRDCRDQAQAVVKVLVGRELGFGPMAAMTGIHVIEGKPSLGVHLIAQGIKRSERYDFRIREKTDARCAIEFFERVDGKAESLGVEVYTIEEAKRAGLTGKKPWKEHPQAMLFARCMGQGYRSRCPDALACAVYAEGEIEAQDVAAEVRDAPAAAAPVTPIVERDEPPAGHAGEGGLEDDRDAARALAAQITDQAKREAALRAIEGATDVGAVRRRIEATLQAQQQARTTVVVPPGEPKAAPPPAELPRAQKRPAPAQQGGGS